MSGDFPVQLVTGITSFYMSQTRTRILADLSDTQNFPREDVRYRDARVYTFTKLHDRCSLMSVSVPWNSSLTTQYDIAASS